MYKVLVVEDVKIQREILLDILGRNFGRELEFYDAANGRSAVRIGVLRKVDLVLMDVHLPGLNGIEAAHEIREQLPDSKIIFITAYSRFEFAREAVRLGASDYILKPYTEEDIVAAVGLALRELEEMQRLRSLIPVTLPAAASAEEDGDKYDPHMAQVIRHIQEYLRNNYMNAASLDYISEVLGFSNSYLSTQFKHYAHMNFVDYLTEVRVKEAARLLSDPLRSTSDVAKLVGYGDLSYFSHVFKKRTGLSPKEYRRRLARLSDQNEKKY